MLPLLFPLVQDGKLALICNPHHLISRQYRIPDGNYHGGELHCRRRLLPFVRACSTQWQFCTEIVNGPATHPPLQTM